MVMFFPNAKPQMWLVTVAVVKFAVRVMEVVGTGKFRVAVLLRFPH